MTTFELKLNLPDDLAKRAQTAGLLTPEAIESMLREHLKAEHLDELFTAMDRMAAVAEPSAMSPEDVAEEIRVMRVERRAQIAR